MNVRTGLIFFFHWEFYGECVYSYKYSKSVQISTIKQPARMWRKELKRDLLIVKSDRKSSGHITLCQTNNKDTTSMGLQELLSTFTQFWFISWFLVYLPKKMQLSFMHYVSLAKLFKFNNCWTTAKFWPLLVLHFERSEKYYFLFGFSFVCLEVDRMLFHLLFFPGHWRLKTPKWKVEQ